MQIRYCSRYRSDLTRPPLCSPWRGHAHNNAGPSTRPARKVRCLATSGCLYQALGVSESATLADIKSAFRKLALKLHPDVNPTAHATEHFKACKEAYKTLSDPKLKAAYDSQRMQQARVRSSRGASSSSSGWSKSRRHSSYYTAYGMEDAEEVSSGETRGFWAWHQSGSWQSSWQANQKKQRRRQQEQQQQRGGEGRRPLSEREEIQQLLTQLDGDTLAGLRQVFGSRLQRLHSKEELVEFLGIVVDLEEDGVEFDIFGSSASYWEEPREPQISGTRDRSGRTSIANSRTRSSRRSNRRGGQKHANSRQQAGMEEPVIVDLSDLGAFGNMYSMRDLEELLELVDVDGLEEVMWSSPEIWFTQ